MSMIWQDIYPLFFNPCSVFDTLCDLGLRDYSLNFPKSLARWFSLNMHHWGASVEDWREGEERKNSPLVSRAVLQFSTCKSQLGPVSESSITPTTSHLHHIRDIRTSCTAWWHPHPSRRSLGTKDCESGTSGNPFPDLQRWSGNSLVTTHPKLPGFVKSSLPSLRFPSQVLVFQKLFNPFSVFVISGEIPTIISIFLGWS